MIKYNSLYRSLKHVTAEWHAGVLMWSFSWTYFKFYEDGSLIFCSTSAEPVQMVWFNKETFLGSTGKYTINSSKIEGSINSPVGESQFSGIVNETSMVLQTTNKSIAYSQWNFFELIN